MSGNRERKESQEEEESWSDRLRVTSEIHAGRRGDAIGRRGIKGWGFEGAECSEDRQKKDSGEVVYLSLMLRETI